MSFHCNIPALGANMIRILVFHSQ